MLFWIVDHNEHFAHDVLLNELNANGLQQTISISTLSSGVQPNPIETEAITLLVSGVDENCSVSLREVLVVDAIPLKAAQVPVSSKLNNLEHLKDISFKELSDKTVGLLIGIDASVVFRALESRFGPEGTHDAIRTSLGWVLFGPALRCQCCADNEGWVSAPRTRYRLVSRYFFESW